MKSSSSRAVFRHTRVTRTFKDPCGPRHVYAPYGHFFTYYSLFFPSLFLHKRLYHPLHHQQSHERLSPSLQHHILLHPSYILLFTQHSPVICKDNFPLVYMYKSSRYYAVFHIDLGSIFPWSPTLKVLKLAPLQPSSFWLLLPATSWYYH